jgi:hypothetical protein
MDRHRMLGADIRHLMPRFVAFLLRVMLSSAYWCPHYLSGFVVWMHKAAWKRVHIIGGSSTSGCITDGLQPEVKRAA